MISEIVGNLLILIKKVLDLRPKSVCAVEVTMYRIYSSTSHTFLYLKSSPKTGVRLILEAILVK